MEFEELYDNWRKRKDPRSMALLVRKAEPVMNKFIGRYQADSNLPPQVVRSYGKKFMIKALKTYDPKRGASFATHLNRNMQQINRVNYQTSGVFRMSEELQMGINKYKAAFDEERDRLGRDPTAAELADKLGWTVSKVERTGRQAIGEVSSGAVQFDPNISYGSDSKLDYVYYDLPPQDKLIMQYKTGYGGSPQYNNKQIAKKLGISESSVSQKSLQIAKKIKDAMRI